MKRFWYLAYVAALALFGLTMLSGGYQPGLLVVYSGMVAAFGISFALLLALYRPSEIIRVFRSIGNPGPASRSELLFAQAFFGTWQQMMILLAPFNVVLGCIHVLEGLGQGDVHALGEGLSLAFCGIWYCCATILFVTVPCQGAVLKKLALLAPSGGMAAGQG